MSSNRDTKKKGNSWLRKSRACDRMLHWLCVNAVACPCTCHTALLDNLLDELLKEANRRAALAIGSDLLGA